MNPMSADQELKPCPPVSGNPSFVAGFREGWRTFQQRNSPPVQPDAPVQQPVAWMMLYKGEPVAALLRPVGGTANWTERPLVYQDAAPRADHEATADQLMRDWEAAAKADKYEVEQAKVFLRAVEAVRAKP